MDMSAAYWGSWSYYTMEFSFSNDNQKGLKQNITLLHLLKCSKEKQLCSCIFLYIYLPAGWTSIGLWMHCCCQAIRVHTSDSISCSRPCSSSWNTSCNSLEFSVIPVLFVYECIYSVSICTCRRSCFKMDY